MKAPRNKTIDISIEDGLEYLNRCIDLTGQDDNKSQKLDYSSIKNKTILADTLAILPKLPDNFVDLLIVDPPYNLNKDFGDTMFKSMSSEDYEAYTSEWVQKCIHTLKATASIYVCCDWRSSSTIEKVLSKHFIIRNRITWQREKGRGSSSNWKNGMEDIWYATNSKNYCFNADSVKLRRKVIAPYKDKESRLPKDFEITKNGNFRNTYPSNFWDDISIPYWSMPENTSHPTQKPEKLLAKLILASSNENDFILDPFSGSGSSLVTAKKLNRRFLGIERNKQYCIFTEKRLEMADEDSSIQGYEDGVFWERNTGAQIRKMRQLSKNN